MKKVLAVLAAAAILCACGCSLQTNKNNAQQTTEPVSASGTAAPLQEDRPALPDVNDSGSTTAAVTDAPAESTTVLNNDVPTTAPTTTAAPDTTTAAPTPTDPTKPTEKPTETAAPTTTEKPTETTTEAPKTAELLESAVLAPIRSGTYTMTVSAFGKDRSADDKLMKIVRGGETAYWITIPAAGLTYKVFPSGGKYYIATPSKYSELTKAQYDAVCKSFNNAFCNFSALKYQKTDTAREGLKKYTREYFELAGNTVVLWYNNGSLFKLQVADDSLPMTVSGGADSAYFTLDPSLEQVEYAQLESLVSLAGAFFS